jgi:hypothetical protein
MGVLLVGAFTAPASFAATTVHTTNFAGYSGTAPTPVTSFTGGLTVPTVVTCPASGNLFMDAQIFLNPGVANSWDATFGWNIECNNGTASYGTGTAGLCPTSGGLCAPFVYVAIAPGDTLKFSLSEAPAAGTTTVKVTNVTQKQFASGTAHATPSFTLVTAETSFCCNATGGNISPIPSFTSFHYSSLKFNGALLSSFANLTKYVMFDGTVEQVGTSAISTGGSFSTPFKHT